MKSYDYEHREGVHEISWEDFAAMYRSLVEALAGRGVDTVIGVARAGLFPATAVAAGLRCDLYPVRVTRREGDRVVYDSPVWKVDVSPEVAGRVVAVIDEIADTGETLALVANRAHQLGAARVVTAALVCHTWANPAPDVAVLTSDALVIFPWDRRVYVDGVWQIHPELREALGRQEKKDTESKNDGT